MERLAVNAKLNLAQPVASIQVAQATVTPAELQQVPVHTAVTKNVKFVATAVTTLPDLPLAQQE